MLSPHTRRTCQFLPTDSNIQCGEKVNSDYPPILCSQHRNEYKLLTGQYKTHSQNADALTKNLVEGTAELIAQLDKVRVTNENQIDELEKEISVRRKHHMQYFQGREDIGHKKWLEERERQLHEARALPSKLRATRDSLAGRTPPTPPPALVEDITVKKPRAPSPNTLPRQPIPPDCRAVVKHSQHTPDALVFCAQPIANHTGSGAPRFCQYHRRQYDVLADYGSAGLRQAQDVQPVVDNIKVALDQGKLKDRSMHLDQLLLEEYKEYLANVITVRTEIYERFSHHGCEDVDIWGGATLATLQLQRVDASLSLERLQGADLRERLERVSEERSSAQEQCKKVRVEQKEEMKNKTAEATGAWMGAMLGTAIATYMGYRVTRKQRTSK